MRSSLSKPNTKPYLLLLGLFAVLYLFSLRAYYVGFFNDDAFHVIGARSLLEGRYVELNHPDQKPLVHYGPGYPLLLTPIALVAGDALLPYQLFSIFLLLLGLYFLIVIFRDHVDPLVLLACVLLSALNPSSVSLSGVVLSDVGLFAFTWVFFCALKKYWTTKKAATWVWLGILAGFGFYIRPVGGLYPMVLALCLGLERRWRPALISFASASLFILFYLIRNSVVKGDSLVLGSEFLAIYGGAQSSVVMLFQLIWDNAHFYLHDIFVRQMFRWPANPAQFVLNGLVMVGGMVCLVLGWKKMGLKGWKKYPALFLIAYFAIHLIWSRQASRYYLPLLPLVYLLVFWGIHSLGKTKKAAKKWIWAPLALSLFLTAFPIKKVLTASLFLETPLNTPPKETYAWISSETPESAIIACNFDGRVNLHTKRKTLHIPNFDEDAQFNQWVRQSKVDFVMVSPLDLNLPTKSQVKSYHPLSRDRLARILSNPQSYQEVFRSDPERRAIYRVSR